MLGNKKTKNTSVYSGIGIALLLCALMALMPMAGFVDNNASDVEFVDSNDTAESDIFALPEAVKNADYEYEPSDELIGMRDQTTKTYVTEDGKFAQLNHATPVHFMDDSGAWEDIDLNVVATANGWEVTENTYTTHFSSEMAYGVAVQPNQFVDPIITGIAPMVVTLDDTGTMPQPYHVVPSDEGVAVGGNVLRYPVGEGFDLDYTVESTQLKQNLVIRERPVLEPDAAWFGLSEAMQIPSGFALYLGDEKLGEEMTQTQEALHIRHVETGELLAEIPVPLVVEEGSEAPYTATFFIQVFGPQVIITTAVEADWLMSEDRVFPLAIDPTIKVYSNAGGYCYRYYRNCYSSTTRYTYRYYSQMRYMPWHRYTFSSSNQLPSGATVDAIKWKQYLSYRSGSTTTSIKAVVLEDCGSPTLSAYSHTIPTATCSGALSASQILTGSSYNSANSRRMITSLWNSNVFDTYSIGNNGWKTADICTSATSCASSTNTAAAYITSAQTNSGTVGLGQHITTSTYLYSRTTNTGSTNSYLEITYSGGTDSDAPISGFVPYSGITSFVEGARTFFTTLTDMSGIDTTSANAPTLHYALNNGSYSSVTATSIGTCSTTSSECRFKATTPTISAGDYVEYYWKYQDLNVVNGANVGYDPALTGSQTTPTPYYFAVADVTDAGDAKKLTVLTTDVHASDRFSPGANQYIDRQMTHFDSNNEFYFEFDTSSCGTGSSSCFYTPSDYFDANWIVQHTTTASSGYNGMGGTRSNLDNLHKDDGGYLTISAADGPGMNLMFLYDSTANAFGMVGIGTSPSIDSPLTGGTSADSSRSYGYTQAYKITLGADYGGMFGKFGFGNETGGAGTNANRLCVTSNGFTYFWRSPYSSYDYCSSAYYYAGSWSGTTSYRWSGFALAMGYYGRMASTCDVTYKIGNVAPTPDTFKPEFTHSALADSHSKSRTISATIADAGDPAAGLNVSTSAGVGPTMYYRVTPDGGTAGAWTAVVMTQESSSTRAECQLSNCDWSADIEDLERGDTVEYYMKAQDVSSVASGVNIMTTSTESFSVGDPNKMFIVEWRDMGYRTTDVCTYQAVFYDVTNEIEFKYDDACTVSYDAATVGFMDQSRTMGQTIRHRTSTQYITGTNPHPANYRISTSSTGSSYESFDRGLSGLVNADASDIMGSSGGNPSGYYCASSYYWNTWANKCADNIPMPDGFNFTYFGTDYNYTDSNDRINLGRHGNMHFVSSGSTALVRSMTTWYGNMPQLPYSSSSFARAGTIAPYWSYYGTYYCYQNTNFDCGVYYRTMPFEGKGTDVTSDITQDTTWDATDSPIRINPSGDYLTISADLTIQPGVTVSVAAGKGISFDGTCDQMTLNGNSTDHILFEGADGAEWKGMAFTAACSTGTDDRHTFSYVDFANTSDAAISAGSRHGASPSTNSNVGNFTMDHVTFTNVGSAFSHGSGQGTVVAMSNFNVDGADSSCFDFAEDTVAILTEGAMKNCNTDGNAGDGAIVNVAGSTSGSLFLENTSVTNAYVNLIDVDFASVTVSNVTATATTAQSGTALSSAAGSGSDVMLHNFDADDYATVSIEAMDSLAMTTVDFGTAAMTITPGGTTSTGSGPSGENAVFDDVTAGNMAMTRTQPGTFDSVSVGTFSMTGNAITSDLVPMNLMEATAVTISGCGWNVHMIGATMDGLSSNGCSVAANTVVVELSDFSHSNTVDPMVYARYSAVTLGQTDVTTSGTGLADFAYADTNSDVRLIHVLVDGATSAYDGTDGKVTAASSSEIWYGGLATAYTYRMALINGAPAQVYKSGHFVSATLVDSSGSELYEVGSHVTDANGMATVWVITSDESGNNYDDHNLRAFGAAGQNETLYTDSWYPTDGTYTVGDSIDLLLEPAPVEFDQAGMNCAWIAGNMTLATTYDAVLNAYVFDSTPMTLAADLELDGCNIVLLGSVLKVKSTATSSPVLTISDGGSLTVTVSPDTGAVGAVKAVSSTYGLHMDIQDGTLDLDGGVLRDVAQDTTTGAALVVGSGATLVMSNSATVYGSSAPSASMATVKVDGGTVNIADSSIINTGQTGTALWVEASGGTIENVIVKNAAVGIQSYNGAPQVDGFTATDNTVGVDIYGGMSLPTIYRSTLLSGENTGWKTYKIDLSTYLSNDYLQIGWNSIYGGGNAHPTYSSASASKYYMITDRYNVQLEDTNGNAWNITSSSDLGYYPYSAADPASGVGSTASYVAGATGGVPSWSCNYYGFSYGPNYPSSFVGYFYYLYRYWPGGPGTVPSYPAYYQAAPDQFGFDWENIEGVTPTGSYAYYPYHYWGMYYTSYHGGTNGPFTPPEGYGGGYPSSYNVCGDRAYSYYMSPGQGARLTMPMVDISASNISKVSLYIDILHNRADNYQDRLEFVARAGNDAASLGEYVRESGTPLFKDGSITGADTGIEIGGAYAAGAIENVAVSSPTDAGLEITGQTASTVDGLEVDGGTYGVLISNSASGSVDLENLDLDSQTSAGVYYTKDLSGALTGTVANSGGAAFKYGQNTNNDVDMSGMTISSNAIGIETAGAGDFTLTDMTMSNNKDVVITGSSNVDFIEGTVDVDSVDVTGSGVFSRMRTVDITLSADSNAVSDATVTLLDADGGAAGSAVTDSLGVANDLEFVTATVDNTGKNVPSLAGYTALTVAEVEYDYTSSTDNIADFRYANAGVSLTDASGNTESIALTQKIAHRVCYSSSSTLYTTVSPCDGYFSTSGSRTLSDGDGGTVKEYGYYGGVATSLTNEIVMIDTPFMYLNGGTDYNFNGSTMLATGAYDRWSVQEWLSKSPGGSGIYMNDAGLYGVSVDSTSGESFGVQFGDYFYAYTTLVANNTVFSNTASIWLYNGYNWNNNYNWEVEEIAITNSTITHYKGYTDLNNAIQQNDVCLRLGGGEGGIVSGNTFNNCGVGVGLYRANYYSYHNGVIGSDNVTISDNTFNDGGEIADIWFYTSGDADGAIVSGNTFNTGDTSNGAIAFYPGGHEGAVISDNTINTLANGIYMSQAQDFTITGNTIYGAGDASHAGIDVSGGYGDIDNNTLIDADGGIVLDSMTNPPAPSSSLCTIRSYSYNYGPATCTVSLAAGKTMAVNIQTDSWGYEASITIDKPDGTTDSWGTNSFSSNTAYEPLATYSDAGSYTLTLRDSYGDGGTDVFMVEGGAAGGYTGPVIADNTIELSAGRVAPNAVGLLMEDCNAVTINSARNSVTLSDNAMFVSNCDVTDSGSTLQGDGTASTYGINADDANGDTLTLSGTTVSGFDTGVMKTSGELYLTGAASLAGDSYGVYVDDVTVSAITASVDGGTTGTGLYVVDSDDVWVYPMDASGLVGMYVENSPFRWDGGTVDATTALEVVEAQGSVENMTWADADNQINAGTNAYVTSIGNTIDASKLIVDSSATIDEANLFSMTSTHLTATPTKEVSMLIQSTDGTRASYVSTSFQPEVMNVDGSDADWNGGNALNPSGYAMPGKMSGDGTNDMMVTYIEGDDLYIGLTGEDLSTSDLLIYLSVDGAGSSTGYNLGGAHTLPFQANYVLWADSESSYDLYSYGFLGWGPTSLSTASVDVDFSGSFAEISIPFSRMGGTPAQVDIVAIVQGETTADVSTVHPTQNIDSSNTLQSFTEYMTVELTHDDLLTGAIADEVLVYRSYKGSNTPSAAKNYDVMIKTEADCEYDWATTEDVSLATNVNLNMDMARACPEIQASLADVTVDEDSGAYTFSLTNMADDVQDLEADLTWTSSAGNVVAYDNVLVDWAQNGHAVTITPLDDQFGTMDYEFTVVDSNGLSDTKNISFEVVNVNDAPVICNVEDIDCMPIFSQDGDFENILTEGFGVHSKFLGNVSNASKSYIRDMANEQSPDRQVYDWDASVTDCTAFSVEVNALNELVITENTNNELGGSCTVTLTLSDDGLQNSEATPYEVDFSVAPVNDAPVIPTWDRQNGTVMEASNGSIPAAPWQISLMEDDTNVENLTYDLSAVMSDVDTELSDLTWTVEPTVQCTYTNYFTTTIVGDQLVFTLIPDATTNAKDWEIDYLNDNGIHQIGPSGSEFCKIRLVLEDTATAPSYVPNYDTTVLNSAFDSQLAPYVQGQDDIEIGVRVENVREQVADYYLDSVSGFDFNGVTNIMTGTYVPVTVKVGAGGDEGPFTYDHMLAVTFHSDGHQEDEPTRYYTVPSYGTTVSFDEMVYITKDTTNVWVEMDVLTCLNDPCDLTAAVSDRFQTDDPASHRANNNGIQGADWSKPGQYGSNATQTSERRPLLEDSNWCNNRMTSLEVGSICNHANQPPGTFEATSQSLPSVVRTIGASSVPSFAPSIVVVSLTGLFVSALAFSSRRADDEEEVTKTMVDDDAAVSPVIATILMVAITVVLSGVIYVWASSLADVDTKGVPRITFDIEDIDAYDADTGHWRISVQAAETDLATQAVVLRIIYTDADGNTATHDANLADTNGVYGFNPDNSDAFVTFVDQVNKEGTDSVSTFNTGDTIFVRTHGPDGTPLEDVTIQLSYAPNVGQGALLKQWNDLSYDTKA